MAGKVQYTDGYWWSKDGLRLHYLDYAGPKGKPPIICIPGLTRNARDFAHVAERLAGEWRVICIDLRGRGESAYAKFPLSYAPLSYAQDIEDLFAELKLRKVVMFGTSLGGIVTLILALAKPGRIVGALLNDIGPEVDPAGIERIKGFVGKMSSAPTWVHAARQVQEAQGHAHPTYTLEQWIALAKRLCRLTSAGRIVPDYDIKIAEPFRHPTEAVDLWPAYEALGEAPVTILRGATSDILSEATAKEMARRLPGAKLVKVPDTGHPPELDEPASIRAIDALMKAVAA